MLIAIGFSVFIVSFVCVLVVYPVSREVNGIYCYISIIGMKKILLLLGLLLCVACSTVRYIEVPTTVRDTVRIVDIQHDSVYVSEGYKEIVRNDTVYVDRVKYEYKYKMLVDTLYKVQIDSVAYPVEVPVDVPYVPKPVKWLAWVGVAAVVLVVLWIVIKFIKL